MNDVIKCIKNRRSIRDYQPKPITKAELEQIIDAGLSAPSAMNQQPWHFSIIQDRKTIDAINIAVKAEYAKSNIPRIKERSENPDYNMFYNAPILIIVSGEMCAKYPTVDCSAATQNMLLAAESLDIGSCWIGGLNTLFDSKQSDKFRQLARIPSGYKFEFAFILGYKTDTPTLIPEKRVNTVSFIE